MINNAWKDYLYEYILLKNEELNLLDIRENNGIMDIPVVKKTARTRRTVAMLTVGVHNQNVPPDNLVKNFTSPKTKKPFELTNETYEWIRNGWIIREYRLAKDERTVKSEQYRMGLSLFRYKKQIEDERETEKMESILEWKNQWNKIKKSPSSFNLRRKEILNRLKDILDEMVTADRINHSNSTWRFQKQLLFLHFLVAFYQISMVEHHFDWKQIGARYYRKIGGSKEFDSYKKEFIEGAEELLEYPLHLLGLSSLGTITPIYFTGPMHGESVSYDYGPIHATTDIAVFTEDFQTDAQVLWLVENRGILTRMAYEKDFLLDSKSLVLGIDGQLRSAHRRLIEQLVSNVKQVIIWTDVDEAGLTIAKNVGETVEKCQVIIKWIVPPLEVVVNVEEFKSRYEKAIQVQKEEQEQEIGGVEQWKKWISP
ncbi:DUF2399 domain-containing protein [Bacillus sp. APMAM]|uniref:DUF2399 domain-containing protein n=1 Tax=Margalitia sp. FSL K6-0131 TaxID=2954604 RepID=UPI000F85EE56|nr:DUF2399 domain-containing protein [Bacillus sp. APMAM]RTZ53550.1 DUF2399 domain-containing protein [Bacillus sp. SAJ1]